MLRANHKRTGPWKWEWHAISSISGSRSEYLHGSSLHIRISDLYHSEPIHTLPLHSNLYISFRISGWLVIACGIGDLFATETGFIEFWLYVYLWVMALVLLLVDMPIMLSTQSETVIRFQLKVFDWIKLFRRIWGRCILYIVMMFTCGSFLANDDDPSDFRAVPWIAGVYLLVLIILSFVFSFIAAKKYNAIREYIIQSTVLPQSDGDYSEDEEEDALVRQATRDAVGDEEIAMKKFIAKFNELDTNDNGQLGMDEIRSLGQECGNTFSHSELHAMMLLLDRECNGVITRPEWILQLKKHDHLYLL